jgi:hypothetical protein
VDRRRLADIRAGTAGQQQSGGSGYLVGPRLVLTCRHVIADEHGRPWPRLEVRLGHPGDGPLLRVAAVVAWVHTDQDAALVRIEGEPFTGGGLVRWGWFAGADPVRYTGLGYPQFADYESGRGVEQLGGMLPPLAVGADGGFVLDQGAAPDAAAGRAWPGVSGAAVFCQGLLTAVVTRDDLQFGNRRLHAVPASALLADPGFAQVVAEGAGAAAALEAVELAGFLQPPAAQVLPRTPGSLLAAGVEAVEFTGRDKELADLAAWRDRGEGFAVMLVAGEGGQGKTRLARQFAARSRQAGWAAGFLAPRASGTASGDGGQLQATVELAGRIREATRPVLLVADYAETRPDEITALADILASSPPAQPVRVLLLSRTAGAWWATMADALGPHLTSRISLESLTRAGQAREAAFAAAVTGLARYLAMLPEPVGDQRPDRPWHTLAAQLAAQPPWLDDPRLGNALSLQITALTSLLAAASGQVPTPAFGERELVGHERGYLRRAAARRRLFQSDILSDLADDDERAAEAWAALERALAGVILLGPCDPGRAQLVGALASDSRASDVVNWLAALYPPPVERFSLGTVQPDRLAELLLGPVLIQQSSLLAKIGTLAETVDDGYGVLFTLMRVADHPGFTQVGDHAADLIAARPDPFAVVAPVLAATLPQPDPLRHGLLRLGQHDPQAFRNTAYKAVDQLPRLSVSGALFSAALTTVVTEILRPLAQANSDAYLPDLATSLNNLGQRLADAGLRQAALPPTQEAVTIRRQLAEANPDAYLPYLAMALNNLGKQLAEAGQRQAALAPTREAASTFRQLAEVNPDAYLPDLATALNNLGNALAEAGQRQAALAPAQEAVTIRRQLAEANPDAYLPYLAMALNNLGNRLAEAGQREAALATAQEAASTFRQLAEANPDAYLPYLAMARYNLANVLVEAGRPEAALAAAQEAADTYRPLAEANPDAYLPDLAMALNNLGIRLAEAGRPEAALAAAQEAADTYRPLAEANPDTYLPKLAAALNNLGIRLAEAGRPEAALVAAQEAADTYRPLAEANPDTYLPKLAAALNNFGALLAKVGRGNEISTTWESAIAFLTEASSRLALTVAYSAYQLSQPDAGTGVELLLTVLMAPGVPGPVQADARQLLRGQWRQHPQAVEESWQSVSTGAVPGWLRLSDDQIDTVIGWIGTSTWAEARQYFADHSGQLLSGTTASVLDELALRAPQDLISQHRGLLDAIREHGPDAAYQPLLTSETLCEWIAAPDWDASRAFLRAHPELLDQDILALLGDLAGHDRDAAIIVHQAVLTLAMTAAGIDAAYQSLQDVPSLQAMASAAITARDAAQLQACAQVEALVQDCAFAGAVHMVMAWLLSGPAGSLPDGWASELQNLAARADPEEKETALAELTAALADIPADSAAASQLRHILSAVSEA